MNSNNFLTIDNSNKIVNFTIILFLFTLLIISFGCNRHEDKGFITEPYTPPPPYQVCQDKDFQEMDNNEILFQKIKNIARYDMRIAPYDTDFPTMARQIVLSEEILTSCEKFSRCVAKEEDSEALKKGLDLCNQNNNFFHVNITSIYPKLPRFEDYNPASYCESSQTSTIRGPRYAFESILVNGIPQLLSEFKNSSPIDPSYLHDMNRLCEIYRIIDPEQACASISPEALNLCEDLNEITTSLKSSN